MPVTIIGTEYVVSKQMSPREAIKPLELAKKKIQNAPFFLPKRTIHSIGLMTQSCCWKTNDRPILRRTNGWRSGKAIRKDKSECPYAKRSRRVCIIDSFVVDKRNFSATYKLSEESGKLFTYNQLVGSEGKNEERFMKLKLGTRYTTVNADVTKTLDIFTKNKMLDQWGEKLTTGKH